MDIKLSYYSNVKQVKATKVLGLQSFLEGVKNGEWQDIVLDVRNKKIDKKKDAVIPAVTLSALFSEKRSKDAFIEKTGIMQIDVDAKDQDMTIVNRDSVEKDPYTYALFDSISGNGGFKVLVRIDKTIEHKEIFDSLKIYYLKHYNILIDIQCSDITRLCYVSYDPDLYLNENAKVYSERYTREQKTFNKKFDKFSAPRITIEEDLANAINEASGLNLFDDYEDYLNLAFALSSEFGAGGEHYFHTLCKASSKYEPKKASNDYQRAVTRGKQGVTIKTLYFKLKEAGINIKSQKTARLEQLIKHSKNPKEDAKKLGIENADKIIDQLLIATKNEDEQTEIQLISDLIKLEDIKFNEVERNYEFQGELMNDRILSHFYVKVWESINDNISKDKIFTLIQNPDNHTSYHPIRQWFEKNKGLKTDKEFEKLKKCFDYSATMLTDRGDAFIEDFLDVYLKKWLLGIIASAHGTYSLLVLVLLGQQGTNKTNFFRNLLPVDLRKYYSDNTLDEGKDSEILMCKKLLIIDDEFGGKSKKDANKLKRLSSQQTFSIRMPYGRVTEDLERLAVLGGTSNEDEVINDPTGNRRIIPLTIKNFDFKAYDLIDKDKLFIELYNEWKTDKMGFVLSKHEIDMLNKCTEKNQEVIAEEEIINKLFRVSSVAQMTTTEVMLTIQSEDPMVKTSTKRVGMVLKKLKIEQKLAKMNGKTTRVYPLKKA